MELDIIEQIEQIIKQDIFEKEKFYNTWISDDEKNIDDRFVELRGEILGLKRALHLISGQKLIANYRAMELQFLEEIFEIENTDEVLKEVIEEKKLEIYKQKIKEF